MARKRVELTPADVSEKAFTIYSISYFEISEDSEVYYIDGSLIGSIEDLNNYLEEIADSEGIE